MVGIALLGLAAVAVIALIPWESVPRDGEGLRNVGVPQQYRELMDHSRPATVETPQPVVESDDPLVSLEPLTPRPPEPPPPALAMTEAPPAPPLAAMSPPPAKPAPVASAPAATPPPAAKPRALMYTARATPYESAPVSETPDLAKGPVSPSYRVQIAATGTDAEAEAAWRDVRRAFPDETQDRNLAVRLATVKGRVVRRALVTGFPSSEAARAFCALLAAANHGCMLRGKD